MSVPCNRCDRPLPKWELARQDRAQCPECGAYSIVRVFPALFYSQRSRGGGGRGAGRGHLLRSSRQTGRGGVQPLWPVCLPALRGRFQRRRVVSGLLHRGRFQRQDARVRKLAHPVRFHRAHRGRSRPLLVWPFTALSAPIALFVARALLEPAAQPGAALAVESGVGRSDRPVRDRGVDLGRRLSGDEVEDLTVADSRQRYRKLPGRRRGFIFSASLWTGADHLLSVKSTRFQEHYKRFYFRDIQAIVITRVPRFVISTRAVASASCF